TTEIYPLPLHDALPISSRFNLAIRDPCRVQRLQSEVAKLERGAAPGFAAHPAALLLAVLHFLWHQHGCNPLYAGSRRRLWLPARQNLAFIDPTFHSDHAIGWR